MCPDDVIYQVWVGSSLREQTKLTLVEEYCKDCGLYFKQWSPLVDSALNQAKSQFRKSGNVISNPFRSVSVSISELYRMIIDDSFVTFESKIVMSRFEKWMRFNNTLDYYSTHHNLKCNTSCHPSRRLYLSLDKVSESSKAALCVLGVILLCAADILVSYIFNF